MALLDEIKSQMNENYNDFEKTIVPQLRKVAKEMIPQQGYFCLSCFFGTGLNISRYGCGSLPTHMEPYLREWVKREGLSIREKYNSRGARRLEIYV